MTNILKLMAIEILVSYVILCKNNTQKIFKGR